MNDPYGWIIVCLSLGLLGILLLSSGCSSKQEQRADCIAECGKDFALYNPDTRRSISCFCFVVPE